MTITSNQNRTLFNELAALFREGQLIFPKDTAYEQVRQLWNGRVKTQPVAIARCLTVEDVIHTVRWARTKMMSFDRHLDILHYSITINHSEERTVRAIQSAIATRQSNQYLEVKL